MYLAEIHEDYISKFQKPKDKQLELSPMHKQISTMSTREREMFEQMQSQPEIKFEKRSMEKQIKENSQPNTDKRTDYTYFVYVKASCSDCKISYKSKETKEIVSKIVDKSRVMPHEDQILAESKLIKICPKEGDNQKHNFNIWLEVSRKPTALMKSGEKSEPVGKFEYYPPFTLFDKICGYIKNGILIPQRLRRDKEDLFWNLIFRFRSDQIDYRFILPYEKDLIEDDFDVEASFGFMSNIGNN